MKSGFLFGKKFAFGEKIILTSAIFLMLALSISLLLPSVVSATVRKTHFEPSLFRDSGSWIYTICNCYSQANFFLVDGMSYPRGTPFVSYGLKIHNANNQGMWVYLTPDPSISNFVSTTSVYVPAGRTLTLTNFQVWIGGSSMSGKITINYKYDDNLPLTQTYITYIGIAGTGDTGDPDLTGGSCQDIPQDICSIDPSIPNSFGIYTAYSCFQNFMVNASMCTPGCCKTAGGPLAFCSSHTSRCISPKNVQGGNQGNIALVCVRDDCSSGIEPLVSFLFQFEGWTVTGKSYKSWTEDQLKSYDIVACSDENSACNFQFNSMLYNVHYKDGRPFLEIPATSGDRAAYAFDYTTIGSGRYFTNPSLNYGSDYITDGLPSPDVAFDGSKFIGMDVTKLSLGTKTVANSSDGKLATIFKVKEAVDHGRYAYVGLFAQSTMDDMTDDGGTLISNTLKWLKGGDAAFGGTNDNTQPKNGIAFICTGSTCSTQSNKEMIKYLRKIGFVVDGKSQKDWLSSDLSPYKIILCASTSSCRIPINSNIYNATKLFKESFVEIADSNTISAGISLSYIPSVRGTIQPKSGFSVRTKSSNNVTLTSNGVTNFGSGLSSLSTIIMVDKKTTSMSGLQIPIPSSSPIVDAAHINFRGVDQNISSMFYIPASGPQGKYLFIGWIRNFDPDNLTNDGKTLLQNAINWAYSA